MRVAAGLAVLSSFLIGACGSTPYADVEALAGSAERPYSVLVTGGAFLKEGVLAVGSGYESTYSLPPGEDEVVGLDEVVEVLRRGRVFVRAEQDRRDSGSRRKVVGSSGTFTVEDPDIREFLQGARRAGHDLLLVVEGFGDGPVERRGMNGQWPITGAVWLLVGLGMVIPDHTYASQASMRVTLRDVHTGRSIDSPVFSGSDIDLSLIERANYLGILTSIVVPPFWVGDHPESVISAVRLVTTRQLLVQAARRMKSADVKARLTENLPAEIAVTPDADRLNVKIKSFGRLSLVELRVDGKGYDRERTAAFEQKLLATHQPLEDGYYSYEASLKPKPRGDFLQILVQNIAGDKASMTFTLERR